MRKLRVLRNLLRGTLFFIILSLFTGCVCYRTDVMPPMGALYTEVSAPLTCHFDNTPVSGHMVVRSYKMTKFIHDIFITNLSFAWQDVDIRSIADSVGIDKVYYADYKLLNVIGVYAEFTVTIYGTPKNPKNKESGSSLY